MYKIKVPPIKCQGIKTKIVQLIIENADFNNQGRWIEPFIGSGVVGFNFRARNALFCDINPHIIRFYNSIKSGGITPETARYYLEIEGRKLAEKGKEHYYEIRERFNEKGDSLDLLFLNRACFNGIMRFNRRGIYNVPFGHKPKRFSKSYITKIVNQVDFVQKAVSMLNWEFKCQDFRITIAETKESDFIYCDPPYIGRHVDYFNTWNEKDENELYNLLKETRAKFILSTWFGNKYRHNEFVDRFWSSFNIITNEHFYHVGSKEEYRNPMVEALVMNYTPKTSDRKKSNSLPQELLFV